MVTGLQIWYFRQEGSKFDPYNVYADHPEVFSMKLFHGGTFTPTPNRRYFGGKVQYIDLLDIEQFTIDIIHSIVKMLKYDPREIMYYHFKIPNKNLDWGLRALASDDDIVNLSQYVIDTKVIEVFIEHGETTVESYYMPTFKEKIQIRELNNTDEVVELDEEWPIVPQTTRKRKFLGLPKCRKSLDWFADNELGQSSGLGGDDTNVDAEETNVGGDEADVGGDEADVGGDENDIGGDENDIGGDETDVGGDETNVSGDDKDVSGDETDEHIVDDEHIIPEVDVNMKGFSFTMNSDDERETDGDHQTPEVNIDEDDLDVIDYDMYESELDEEDISSVRRAALRKLRKKENASYQGGIVNFFFLGQEFGNREEVKERIRAYSVEARRNIEIVKNDLVRVRAKCLGIVPTKGDKVKGKLKGKVQKGDKGKMVISEEVGEKYKCKWHVYVTRTANDKWLVKSLEQQHICLHSRKVKHCTSTFLAKHVIDLLPKNPEIPIEALKDQMQKHYQVGISRHKAFRAKSKAEDTLKGDAELQYGRLRDYAMELMKANPNTTVKIDVYRDEDLGSNTKRFRRIYVCLGALKQGFRSGGRDLLGLDGAFMKAPFEGQLLTAVSVDANNGIYPVAYGIVESENMQSWLWFLNNLGDDLELNIESNFTFITDRQKGLLPAIKKLFPSAEHRYCVRHICENLNLTWRGGAYKEMVWKCAKATTAAEFNKGMEELKAYNTKAYEWLKKIPAEHWSRSQFSGRAHCDLLINNICEVFNRQLLEARNSPIITALEYVRQYLMKRIVLVQNVIEKCNGPLSPSVTKIFNKVKVDATQYQVDWNGADLYQVRGPWEDQVVVNLEQRICSCRKWEVSGLPCKHAVACINNMNENGLNGGLPEDWVHESYKLETWKNQYTHKINPISGRHYWEKKEWPSTLIPPKSQPKIGRPSKKRKKSVVEVEDLVRGGKLSKKGGISTCSNCKQKGHNKRGCNLPRVTQPSGSKATASGSQTANVTQDATTGTKASANVTQDAANVTKSTASGRKKSIVKKPSGKKVGASGSQPTMVTPPSRVTQPSVSQATMVNPPSGSATPFRYSKKTANRLTPTK